MTAPRDDDPLTSGLLSERALSDSDPVPPEVTARAKAAFDSAKPGKLAVLVHDSMVDGDEPRQKHVLRFEHDHLEVQLHVSVEAAGTLIQGVVDRSGPSRAVLHFYEADTVLVKPIEGATFEFAPAGHGLVRISLEQGGGSPIWTDWFRI